MSKILYLRLTQPYWDKIDSQRAGHPELTVAKVALRALEKGLDYFDEQSDEIQEPSVISAHP